MCACLCARACACVYVSVRMRVRGGGVFERTMPSTVAREIIKRLCVAHATIMQNGTVATNRCKQVGAHAHVQNEKTLNDAIKSGRRTIRKPPRRARNDRAKRNLDYTSLKEAGSARSRAKCSQSWENP